MNFSALAIKPSKEELLFCSYREAKRLKPIYEKRTGLRDKTLHCTFSCMIAYECSSLGAWNLGVFKEVMDLFGKGNAELADIKANAFGIRLSRDVSNKQQCEDYCLLEFQP